MYPLGQTKNSQMIDRDPAQHDIVEELRARQALFKGRARNDSDPRRAENQSIDFARMRKVILGLQKAGLRFSDERKNSRPEYFIRIDDNVGCCQKAKRGGYARDD